MAEFGARLRKIASDLERESVSFALVGGWAVGTWTLPRFTKDVDFAVAVRSDEEAERLVSRLARLGYPVEQALEHSDTARLTTVRLRLPRSSSPEPDIDLLFFSSGIEAELVKAARPMTVLGVPLRVATIGYLLALKLLASDEEKRPQDRIDIRALLEAAGPDDIAEARSAVALITDRGCHRGKDLVAELEAALRPARR